MSNLATRQPSPLGRFVLWLARRFAPQTFKDYTGGGTLRGGWLAPTAWSFTSESDESITPTTAMTVAAVYCAVGLLSDALGTLPLNVYERTRAGRRWAGDHPAYPLLHDRPNPVMTAATFRGVMMNHRLLWGHGRALILRDGGGNAVELWPLLPDRTWCRLDESGKLWHVTRPSSVSQDLKAYPDSEVLSFIGYTSDGIVGESVISYARNTIGAALSGSKFASKFYANSIQPGGVLETDKQLSDSAFANLRKSFEERNAGTDNAFRLLILEEGLRYKPSMMNLDDAEFLGSRKFEIAEIARWFNIPPHMLKDLDKATFSNIEHQGIDYVVNSLRPRLVQFEQEYNRKLFVGRESGRYYTEHAVDGLLRGDIKSRYDAYAVAVNNGWMNPDEVREFENLNPIDGGAGAVFVRPSTMANADKFIAQPEMDRVAFEREVVQKFLADSTINDVIYNLTDIETLLSDVGLPPNVGAEAPELPIVTEGGAPIDAGTSDDSGQRFALRGVLHRGALRAAGYAALADARGRLAKRLASNWRKAVSSGKETEALFAKARGECRTTLGPALALLASLSANGGDVAEPWLDAVLVAMRGRLDAALIAARDDCAGGLDAWAAAEAGDGRAG